MEEYKITFRKFRKHLVRIIRHKCYVFRWCCQAGMPVRGILHDLSKFSPVEFWESVRYFSETESPINVCKRLNGVSYAWMHHKGRNPHHYEYWMDRFDDGGCPVAMPKKCAYEMICDYLGAGQAYNPEGWTFQKEYEWWENRKKNLPCMAMHPTTRFFVTIVLARLANGYQFNRTLLDICWDMAEDARNGKYYR